VIERNPDGGWRSSRLSELSWLLHCFGTALHSPEGEILLLKQVHSTAVHDARGWAPAMEGDGLIAVEPGAKVGVKTADCVPILLADRRRKAVAAVHAGWRGAAAGIAGAAARRMAEVCGTDPADLIAAIGPSIGPCCFEVGPEVAQLFRPLFPQRRDLDRKTKIDLLEANVLQLEAAGVPKRQIDREGAPCTFCGGAEFHSWRRDRKEGLRMIAVIGIRQDWYI